MRVHLNYYQFLVNFPKFSFIFIITIKSVKFGIFANFACFGRFIGNFLPHYNPSKGQLCFSILPFLYTSEIKRTFLKTCAGS